MIASKRPMLFDLDVSRETVEALLPKVIAYLKSELNSTSTVFDEEMISDVRADLIESIELTDDAYEICRSLESRTWTVDARLVDLMSEVAAKRYAIHRKTVKDWVRSNNVTPRHRIGDQVTFSRAKGETETGTIVVIEHETAQYLVFCEHLGHVRVGTGCHGTYVNYEQVQ